MALPLTLLVALCFILARVVSEGTASQYCHAESPQAPVVFCVAANTRRNTSTQSTDLIVTFGHQRSPRGGWAAVGLGEGMFRALMFITYAQESSTDNLVMSVRTGKGHFEPRPAAMLPEVETNMLSLNQSGWFQASFVCYGCHNWTSKSAGSTLQPWIWAYNSVQQIKHPSEQSRLAAHEYWGWFDLEMAEAQSTSGSLTVPSIDETIPNQIIADKYGTEKTSSSWFGLHGGFLAVATMLLYPCGAVAIHSTSGTAFRAHLLFQIPASIGCLIGAAIALNVAIQKHSVNFLEPHILFGLTLLLMIVLQSVLGYTHHQASKLLRKTPWVTKCHRWLGRFIVLGGCLNVILGLQLAGASTVVLIFAGLVTFLDLILIACLAVIAPAKADVLTQEEDIDIDAVPFLDPEIDEEEM